MPPRELKVTEESSKAIEKVLLPCGVYFWRDSHGNFMIGIHDGDAWCVTMKDLPVMEEYMKKAKRKGMTKAQERALLAKWKKELKQ
jgi:hypothetical protein